MTTNGAPASDEIEVSLFGPGYGESILIHIGAGEWVAVDCCRDQHSGDMPALAYLESLGLGPSVIVLLVATHWHDDHVRGISELYAEATNAAFACPVALKDREFLAVLKAPHRRNIDRASVGLTSGVREMRTVFDEVERRKSDGMPASVRWALQDRTLYARDSVVARANVLALSPSDEAVRLAIEQMKAFLEVGADKKRRVRTKKNEASAALWISVGSTSVLLGADLENTRNPLTGWTAAIHQLATQLEGSAELYKVAHHGSTNAHHDDIWSELLCAAPIAVLAPWQLADGALPTDDDLDRLCQLAGSVYVSAPAEGSRSELPGIGLAGEVTIAAQSRPGRITARRPILGEGAWTVRYAPPAYEALHSMA
jgi:hypothetical protein